jgi:uncharacterized protein with von Willebrand factor type A (vWA) domain
MSELDSKLLLLEVFHQLRRSGFALGIGELLAALRAIDGDWGIQRPDAMRQAARLLWCHSPQDTLEFEEVYNAVLAASTRPTKPTAPSKLKTEIPPPPPEKPPVESPPPAGPPTEPLDQRTGLVALPVQTPFTPSPGEMGAELRAYWPVSRRFMVYTWRYLRRPVKDGPRDVLNVEATVEQTARQGFFLHSIYDRRESNDAHLILMIDQDGSMVPFHRFTRDLVDTACEESTIRQVDVMYFHNVPPPIIFRDPHLTEPLPLEQVLV